MKAQERHHLKQNDFAASMARAATGFREHRHQIVIGGLAVILIGGAVSGYFLWRKHTDDQASAMLGVAMAIYESPIAPPPTVPGASQAEGTYPTVAARQNAALKAFQQVASGYPSSRAGTGAAYHAAGALVSLGRFDEAEKTYQDVIARAGSTIYGPMARMGLSDALSAAGQYDRAIKEYTDLSGQRDGLLPVDGVLMELARTYLKAGKSSEARATFKRVVDEFPESAYVSEARQQLTVLN